MNLNGLYQKRIEQFSTEATTLKARYDRLAVVRLVGFLVGLAIFFLLFSVGMWVAWGFALLFLVGFVRFVMWHLKIQRTSAYFARLQAINENELKYLSGDISGFESGEEFVDADHPYTVDLDIFGAFSIFQYINRTVSSIGRQSLADYFSHAATHDEILARQTAVRELSTKLEWRQHLQAKGADSNETSTYVRRLMEWMQDEHIVLGNKKLISALYIVPIIMLIALFIPAAIIPWKFKWVFLLIPIYFLRQTMERVEISHEKTAKSQEMIANYATLIEHIENEDFECEKLVGLKGLLYARASQPLKGSAVQDSPLGDRGTGVVSSHLKKLSYIINQLNVRYNAFAIVLELGGLWSLQYTYKLEKWKAEHKNELEKWFVALREFDALSSLGALYHNNPDWVFPEIVSDTETVFDGEEIGHPLLQPDTRICNDLNIPHRGHIKLITGSNMAGKSTFLRSTALAIVFAMTGAPVCARRFRTPLTQVYTSMRTKDALHESTSSFYAELKRLQFIINAVENGDNIFFLLDEILKGTNSKDRHSGSKALVLQLVRHKGSGLIATHDLELGGLAAQYPDDLENLCFEVDVEGDKLEFTYKIQPGISQSMNATILMRRMGIDV